MEDASSKLHRIRAAVSGGLIVSCQAPAGSPLAEPSIIAAFAATAEINGAAAVRIDSPAHIRAVRERVSIPVLGIFKVAHPGSEVYITPTFAAARAAAEAGADVIAVDATGRERPGGESLETLRRQIGDELGIAAMADVATLEEGLAAESLGFDFIGTTLSGYTSDTQHLLPGPDFALIEGLARSVRVPIIAEGRLRSPEDVRRAFDCGAFAVVVGTAITGMDVLVREFAAAVPRAAAGTNA